MRFYLEYIGNFEQGDLLGLNKSNDRKSVLGQLMVLLA